MITVDAGPMRSGKTLNLIVKASECASINVPVYMFYPEGSERWGDVGRISSRLHGCNKISWPAKPLSRNMQGLFETLPDLGKCFVGFDDAQFFSEKIVDIARNLSMSGNIVHISGLDMDCFMRPFGPMPYLMAIADIVNKHTSICMDCKEPARLSYRLAYSDAQEVIGDTEYVPLCFECYKFRTEQ